MFSLDHTHYCRWLPIFIQSLKELPYNHPNVFENLKAGRFTVQKTNRVFSRISDDHSHEQNKKIIKMEAGAIGILDCPKALTKWIIAAPKIAQLILEHEVAMNNATIHHEHSKTFEAMFRNNVKALLKEFTTEGNPFNENEDMLYTMVTKTVMIDKAKLSVQQARTLGENYYEVFREILERNRQSINDTKEFYDTIKRNKLALLGKNKLLYYQKLNRK